MTDLSLTRIELAEHTYPTPTRNHLSMHNREAGKRKAGYATKASEVRHGYRAKDGTNYMFPTATERHIARQQDNANKALADAERKQRIIDKLNSLQAPSDSWANKQ